MNTTYRILPVDTVEV